MWRYGITLLLLLNVSLWAQSSKSNELTVFAAASLRDVMTDLGTAFQLENKKRVHFNIAGSNVLAQQIVAGANPALYFSANEQWMNHVEHNQRLVKDSRRVLLSNQLVVVAHQKSRFKIKEPKDLSELKFTYLSLANPQAVPAGKYAKSYLQNIALGKSNLWEKVKGRVAPGMDVRGALALVEADPRIIGIVYKTDAAAAKDKVKILYKIPLKATPPIRYSAARIKGTGESETARGFLEFLSGSQAQKIFQQHGFVAVQTNTPSQINE